MEKRNIALKTTPSVQQVLDVSLHCRNYSLLKTRMNLELVVRVIEAPEKVTDLILGSNTEMVWAI